MSSYPIDEKSIESTPTTATELEGSEVTNPVEDSSTHAAPPMHEGDPFFAELNQKPRRRLLRKLILGSTALLAAFSVFYMGRAYERHSWEVNGFSLSKPPAGYPRIHEFPIIQEVGHGKFGDYPIFKEVGHGKHGEVHQLAHRPHEHDDYRPSSYGNDRNPGRPPHWKHGEHDDPPHPRGTHGDHPPPPSHRRKKGCHGRPEGKKHPLLMDEKVSPQKNMPENMRENMRENMPDKAEMYKKMRDADLKVEEIMNKLDHEIQEMFKSASGLQ